MQRSPLSIRTLMLLTVSMLTLLIVLLSALEIFPQWQRLSKIHSLQQATRVNDLMFDVIEKLSVERDVSYAILHAPDRENIDSLTLRLKESRRQSDEVLTTAYGALQEQGQNLPQGGNKVTHEDIRKLRHEIDNAILLPHEERNQKLAEGWFAQSNAYIRQMQDLWMGSIKRYADIDTYVTRHMRFKHLLGTIMDYAGRERAVIGRLLVENVDATPQQQAELLQWQGMVLMNWDMADNFADQSKLYPAISPSFRDAKSHYFTVFDMVRDMFFVPGSEHGGSYPIGVDMWLELATQENDSLNELKESVVKETQRYMDKLAVEARQTISLHIVLILIALTLCAYSYRITLHRVLGPIHKMVEALVGASQGKPVPPMLPATVREDEIGQLARVLNTLQQHMEDMRRTSIMLKRYTHDLERSNKELDDFAYIASHDLKEPLRGIHNHSRFLLEDNKDTLNEESVSRLNRLMYLSQRMEKLVNDLLYFSRLGRHDLAIQSTDLSEVVRDIESMLEVFLAERRARIVMPKKLPTINCDKPRVTEALRNLITNAVKYNDATDKVVEIGILDAHAQPNGVRLRNVFYVKDNGIGIPHEFHQEVFRIFKRLQSGKNKEEDGTGVGLTFVKKIIERHGGIIWLESEPGRGTTFYFTLKEYPHDTKVSA